VNVVITGGHGFLGWHTAARLHALWGIEAIRLGREETADPQRIEAEVASADVLIHLAGVNRAESDEAIHVGNTAAAEAVADAITHNGRPVRVVYANSIQADLGSAYGRSKRASAKILRVAATSVGGSLADVLLPNIFGEHGRPGYNSFVATFCDMLARAEKPVVTDDKEVPLLHAQRAAGCLMKAMAGTTDDEFRPQGEGRHISEILSILIEFDSLYRRGDIPALGEPFLIDLFNTYRSFLFPRHFPWHATLRSDRRGTLFETVRSHGGPAQVFVSTTRPGMTRGDHYHLHKVERFAVVSGEAEIALRRLLDDRIVRFRLGGSAPGYVDMPTLWVHSIRNVGDCDLVTMFWANQLMDPANPDQYPEQVAIDLSA
jgi:UDP-2-acetamido-2,6-beta-L-arabino-hexul-4-ose reductase